MMHSGPDNYDELRTRVPAFLFESEIRLENPNGTALKTALIQPRPMVFTIR